MKEKLISLECAKLAKEKGFNIICRDFSIIGDGKDTQSLYIPTQSLLQKWLREKHNIYIWITDWDKKYGVEITDNEGNKYQSQGIGTYEQTLEVGLLEALKLIKKGD